MTPAPPFPPDADARWRSARDTEHRLIRIIHAYSMTRWGPAMAVHGWRMFAQGTWSDKNWSRAWPVFCAWFAFGLRPRHPELDDDHTRLWPTSSLAEAWAEATLDISAADRAFVIAASRSPWSLLLVRDVVPGVSLTVRDLMTGRPFVVFDPEISLQALPEQVLVSAVLTVDGFSTLLGPAAYAMSGEWRVEARDIREAPEGEPWVTREDLEHYSYEVFSAFRSACEDEDNDGSNEYAPMRTCAYRVSEFAPTLLRWRITADVPEAIEALRPLVIYDDSEQIELELGVDGEPRAEGFWCAPNPNEPDEWQTLGFLHVEEGRMSAEVPTAARADELVLQIARVLPGAELIERRAAGVVVKVEA